MSGRCYGRKQRPTDEEAEGYRESPIYYSLLVPLPCRMVRWITGPLLPRIQEVYDVCYPAFSLCPLCYLFCTQVDFTILSLIFIFACLAGPLLSLDTSTVDHQVTGFHPGSSCQCTPDASVWIWKGRHRRWSEEIWNLGVDVIMR